jgi:hypothetical protein
VASCIAGFAQPSGAGGVTCLIDRTWSGAVACLPAWDSGAEMADAGQTFTLFQLPPRHPAFPDSLVGGQQYADACAVYGLQAIGCSCNPPNCVGVISGYVGVNTVHPAGMGMPESWGCNLNDDGVLYAKTNWTSIVFLQSVSGVCGMDCPTTAYTPFVPCPAGLRSATRRAMGSRQSAPSRTDAGPHRPDLNTRR